MSILEAKYICRPELRRNKKGKEDGKEMGEQDVSCAVALPAFFVLPPLVGQQRVDL
jgi:hypothetical protein